MKNITKTKTCAFLALGLIFNLTASAGDHIDSSGEEVAKNVTTETSDLDFSLILPIWLAGVEGTVGFTPDVTTGIDVGIDDILPTVDMIFASTMEIRKGKLGFTLDGMYMKLGVEGETPGPLLNDISISMKQVLIDGLITYRIFESDKAWLEVLGGARYNYQGNEVTFTRFDDTPGSLSDSNTWVDPFFGIQGRYQLADDWYVSARADYGGFGVSSDSTYNLFGVIGYQIKPGTSMELGYRYLYTDYTQGGFVYDVATKGAFIGFRKDF